MRNPTTLHGTHSGKVLARDQVLLLTVCIMSYGINFGLLHVFSLTTSRSFVGYTSINSVLSEVRDPVRTVKLAAPLAMISITAVYFFINISYLAVVSKRDILESRQIIALVKAQNCLFDGFAHLFLQSVIFPESIRSYHRKGGFTFHTASFFVDVVYTIGS
jgi:amino acid transporter